MNAHHHVAAAVRDAGKSASHDRIATMGAAIAYYAAFSLAPMMVIALGLTGLIFGAGGGVQVYGAIGGLLGPSAALAIHQMVQSAASQPRGGALAAGVGAVILVFGASGVFTQLQESLNVIWRVETKPGAGLASMLTRRLLSFVMIAVIAILVPASLLLGAAIQGARDFLVAFPGGPALLMTLNEFVALAITTLLFAFLFRVVPDVRVTWRDAFAGGFFTALLFTAGKFALAAYLGRSGIESVYGAAGSLIAVLLWVYYSSQIVLIGGEFTRAFAEYSGRVSAPEPYAESVAPLARAEEPARDGAPAVETASDPAALYGVSAAAMAAGGLLLRNARKATGSRAVAEEIAGGFLFGAAAAALALLELANRRGRGETSQGRGQQVKQLKA